MLHQNVLQRQTFCSTSHVRLSIAVCIFPFAVALALQLLARRLELCSSEP